MTDPLPARPARAGYFQPLRGGLGFECPVDYYCPPQVVKAVRRPLFYVYL